ncbi:hypothetical protein BC827DRAFT_323475 [Russula dissimulans]|nr:hypothetical protein BC827DRAFT_323475 [Russula dissimulans]
MNNSPRLASHPRPRVHSLLPTLLLPGNHFVSIRSSLCTRPGDQFTFNIQHHIPLHPLIPIYSRWRFQPAPLLPTRHPRFHMVIPGTPRTHPLGNTPPSSDSFIESAFPRELTLIPLCHKFTLMSKIPLPSLLCTSSPFLQNFGPEPLFQGHGTHANLIKVVK